MSLIIQPGSPLKYKRLALPAWNMQTTFVQGVLHGLNRDSILDVTALIRDDAGAYVFWDLLSTGPSNANTQALEINATQILLYRAAAGCFDNINHNSTAFSRGWINIFHE